MLAYEVHGNIVEIPDANIRVDVGRPPTIDDILAITTQAELELDEQIFLESTYSQLTKTRELFLDYYAKMCEALVSQVKENPDIIQTEITHPEVASEFIQYMITALYTLLYQVQVIPQPTFDALKTYIKNLEPEYLLLLVGINKFRG